MMKSMIKGKDPFDFDNNTDSQESGDDKKEAVTVYIGGQKNETNQSGNESKSKYPRVAEPVQSPVVTDGVGDASGDDIDDDDDIATGHNAYVSSTTGDNQPKQYPGPRDKDDFLTRMKKRAKSYLKINVVSDTKKKKPAGSKPKSKVLISPMDLINKLDCTQDMKDFIKQEFLRERQIYTFLPEAQVIQAILHQYKTHLANSRSESVTAKVPKPKKKSRGPSAKLQGRSRAGASVDTDDNSDVDIEDFSDEETLTRSVPSAGTFSLTPAKRKPRSQQILVRFADEDDSFSISESSQDTPRKETEVKDDTKPRKRGRPKKISAPDSCEEDDEIRTKKLKLSTDAGEDDSFSRSETSQDSPRRDIKDNTKLRKRGRPKKVQAPDPFLDENESKDKELKLSSKADADVESNFRTKKLKHGPEGEIITSKIQYPLLSSASQADEIELFPSPCNDSQDNQVSKVDAKDETECLISDVATGAICGWCHKAALKLKMCSACETVHYCDEICQTNDWLRHKKLCKVVRKTTNKRDVFIDLFRQFLAVQTKTKAVRINSLPVFYTPNEITNDEITNEPITADHYDVKSILKNKVQVNVVLNSPPIYPLEHHVRMVTDGSQEERFDQLVQSYSQDKSRDLNDNKVGGNLDHSEDNLIVQGKQKVSDDKFDEIYKQLEKIHSSPSNSDPDLDKVDNDVVTNAAVATPTKEVEVAQEAPKTPSSSGPAVKSPIKEVEVAQDVSVTPSTSAPATPVNSPSLAEAVRSKSCNRTSSRVHRSKSRVRRMTPYPRILIDEDTGLRCNVRRKIEFTKDAGDDDVDTAEDCEKVATSTEENSESASAVTDEVEASPEHDDDDDITKVKRKLEFSRIEEEDLLSSEGQTDELVTSSNQSQCSANVSELLSQLQSTQGNDVEPSSDDMVQITPASDDNGNNYDQVSGMFSDASSL